MMIMVYFVESDIGGTAALASPVFSKQRYALQYLQWARARWPDTPHRIVEQPLPEGWDLRGDALLAELLADFLRTHRGDELLAELLADFLRTQ